MKRIEHIGIAVKDIEAANKTYRDVMGAEHYKTEEVASEGVITSFFRVGESKIELLGGTNPDSPISKFVAKRGEGIHHVAFYVDDMEAEMERLMAKGFRLLNEKPKPGADNKMVVFLHPKDNHGVLVELCTDKD